MSLQANVFPSASFKQKAEGIAKQAAKGTGVSLDGVLGFPQDLRTKKGGVRLSAITALSKGLPPEDVLMNLAGSCSHALTGSFFLATSTPATMTHGPVAGAGIA